MHVRVTNSNRRHSKESLAQILILLPHLANFPRSRSLKCLIQVTRVDAHLRAECGKREATINTLKSWNKTKYRYCVRDQVQQPQLHQANKLHNLLSVVFPIKPVILFTIIKHKNVFFFFIWPQESPRVVRRMLNFPVRSFNQTVSPGEKC